LEPLGRTESAWAAGGNRRAGRSSFGAP
jgi:hypothetical protein